MSFASGRLGVGSEIGRLPALPLAKRSRDPRGTQLGAEDERIPTI